MPLTVKQLQDHCATQPSVDLAEIHASLVAYVERQVGAPLHLVAKQLRYLAWREDLAVKRTLDAVWAHIKEADLYGPHAPPHDTEEG
jgi:hypothetical protein